MGDSADLTVVWEVTYQFDGGDEHQMTMEVARGSTGDVTTVGKINVLGGSSN